MIATPEAPANGLPPSVEDWLAVYFRHGKSLEQSTRVLRVLYRALAEGEEPSIRELAERAQVGVGTVSRVLDRLRQLGLLETSGADTWGAGRGSVVLERHPHGRWLKTAGGVPPVRSRLRYQPRWPVS